MSIISHDLRYFCAKSDTCGTNDTSKLSDTSDTSDPSDTSNTVIIQVMQVRLAHL